MARARVFTTGQGRKTDATDAHSVALVGTRVSGLRPVVDDAQPAVLRVLVDLLHPWMVGGCNRTRLLPLTDELVRRLNPDLTMEDLAEDLAEIGYPSQVCR